MHFEDAAKQALELGLKEGLKHVDVLVDRREEIEVQIRDGKLEKIEQSTSLGLGIRVIKEGRSGFASTEKLDPDTLSQTLAQAKNNSKFQDPTEVFMPDVNQSNVDPEYLKLFEPDLNRLGVEELSQVGLEAEAAAKEADRRVTSIPYLGVSRELSERLLLSTHGVEHRERSNQVGAYCGVLLEQGERRKSGFEFWSRRQWDPNAGRRLGTRAVKKGAELLNAKSFEGGKMPVVIDEFCAPRLMGMYFRAFHGEAAQKGTSRLKGKLNEEIAIPKLSLLDDPHRPGGGATRCVDAEGTPTKPIKLIDSGTFCNFLHHIESAANEGQFSTGHASRTYDSGISTTTHNLVIEPGDYSLESLCAIPERCLLVTHLEGSSGCNPISGDISIGVQGFLIKNGERTQAIDSVTIAGNFFELLLNIRGIGDSYQPNLSSRYIPALLLDGFVVSG